MALLLCATACAPSEPAADVEDSVTAPTEGVYGTVPPATSGVPSVVLLTPLEDAPATIPERATMDQLGLQFSPTRMLLRAGGTVDFTNSETLPHNVTVTSVSTGETVLNVDTPPDEQFAHTFTDTGGYDVTCEVHPGMRAFLYVTDAAIGQFADDDGTFALEAPPGGYTLRVWNLDPTAQAERQVGVQPGRATEVAIRSTG